MTLSIYLVEDNPVSRMALEEILGALCDCAVQGWSKSEHQARDDLAQKSFDAVLIDLSLAEGSGIGVLRSMKDRAAEQKAIVLTNFSTPAVHQLCASLGADRVFDKCSEIEKLVHYLRECAS